MGFIKATLAFILLLFPLCCYPVLHYTPEHSVDFGNTPIDNVIPLSDGKFVSFGGLKVSVFAVQGDSLIFTQAIYSSQQYLDVIECGADTLYAMTIQNRLDIYVYTSSDGLSLWHSYEFGDFNNLPFYSTSPIVVNQFFVNGCYLTYDNENEGFCQSIYGFNEGTGPELISRTYKHEGLGFIGVYYLGNQYFYLSFNGSVFSSDLITSDPFPVDVPELAGHTIKSTKAIDGDIYLISKDTSAQAWLMKLDLDTDGVVDVEWTQQIGQSDFFEMSDVLGGCIYITGDSPNNSWVINKYAYSDSLMWQLSNSYSFDGSLYHLVPMSSGFLVAGVYQSFLLNSDCSVSHTVNNTVTYLLGSVYLNRYLLLSESSYDSSSSRYKIYDLEEENFIDFESSGRRKSWGERYGQDKIVFSTNQIEIIGLNENGISGYWTVPNTHGFNLVDVYDNTVALSGFCNGQWRVMLYRLTETGGAVLLSENPLSHICATIQFYDASHFVILRYTTTALVYAYYYRIEADYNVTQVDVIESNAGGVYVCNDKVINPDQGGAVVDVSNPNDPIVVHQIALPNSAGWGMSYNGNAYYMMKSLFWSFLVDADFIYYDTLISCNPHFLAGNRILIPGPASAMIASINEISATQSDELTSPPLTITNYPNPFNPSTTIQFSIPDAASTKLVVYNLRGQVVQTLLNEGLPKGMHSVQWNGMDDNGRPVSSGVYFYRLQTGLTVLTGKCLLIK